MLWPSDPTGYHILVFLVSPPEVSPGACMEVPALLFSLLSNGLWAGPPSLPTGSMPWAHEVIADLGTCPVVLANQASLKRKPQVANGSDSK